MLRNRVTAAVVAATASLIRMVGRSPGLTLLVVLAVVAIAVVVVAFSRSFDTGINAIVAFGTLAAVGVAVFQDWLRCLIMRPTFSVSLGVPSHPETRDSSSQRKTGEAWYFGLDVRNDSRWRASNCRVLLTTLRRPREDGVLQPEPMTIPCPFTWSVLWEDPVAVTIDSGKSKRVNFLSLLRPLDAPHSMTLGPVLAAITYNFTPGLQSGKTAYYTIQVDADNLVAESRWVFKVTWDGEWPSDEDVESGRHLRIEAVPTTD